MIIHTKIVCPPKYCPWLKIFANIVCTNNTSSSAQTISQIFVHTGHFATFIRTGHLPVFNDICTGYLSMFNFHPHKLFSNVHLHWLSCNVSPTGHFAAPFLVHAYCNFMGFPDFAEVSCSPSFIFMFIYNILFWKKILPFSCSYTTYYSERKFYQYSKIYYQVANAEPRRRAFLSVMFLAGAISFYLAIDLLTEPSLYQNNVYNEARLEG